jgi:hypothetical protein
MPSAEDLFAYSYHDARARFLRALDAFERETGRAFVRQRHVIDAGEDLSIDTAELVPRERRRVFVAVSGIHGVEGYAGNAIQQQLLAATLRRFDLDRTGVFFVHALNPSGMHAFRRVNARNVDLNRNFSGDGRALYASDSSGYRLVAELLEPAAPYAGGLVERARFMADLARAVGHHGFAPLRQATLAGQYVAPQGLFYGGDRPEAETEIMQRAFGALCERYGEILLADLHTGYGARGRASSLFARADSPEFSAICDDGVRDAGGRDQAYSARGDLVGYGYEVAKRRRNGGVFNGVAVELGTHALGALAQIQDLIAVVRENQVRLRGARSPELALSAQRAFRELFYPSDPAWRAAALASGVDRVESLLKSRAFLP